MTDWPLFSPWTLKLRLWSSATPSSLLSLAYWSAWAVCFWPGCPNQRLFHPHLILPLCQCSCHQPVASCQNRGTIRLMFLLLAFMFNSAGLYVDAEFVAPNHRGVKYLLCTLVLRSILAVLHLKNCTKTTEGCEEKERLCGGTEQMLIMWIIGFQHSVPVAIRLKGAEASVAFLREPHLDLIAYSQVGHTNFCCKYCVLMIDIAHGKGTDEAKQMDFQLWSQKAGEKEECREGWCLVLSEWTNWSRTGGRRENMLPGEPQEPPTPLSPPAKTSTTTPNSMGSFSLG